MELGQTHKHLLYVIMHGALSWKQNIVPMELGYATKTSPAET